jgi:lipid-A-disaccharide synthase-like uncharacterized protein
MTALATLTPPAAIDASIPILWLAVGYGGQALFFARFLVQWLVSERRRASVVPRSFWFLSLGGAALVLAYAIHRRDPVFILGQSMGFVVYVRNLVLLGRGPSSDAGGPPPDGA